MMLWDYFFNQTKNKGKKKKNIYFEKSETEGTGKYFRKPEAGI